MESAVTENAAAPGAVATPERPIDADQPVEGAAVEDPPTPTEVPEDPPTPTEAPEAGVDADQVIDDAAPKDEKHRDPEVHVDVTPEEMRSIIEVIADTGKFWHDWSFLKGLLCLQFKQVLAGYSEVMTTSQGGEQLQGFLDDRFSGFVDGLNEDLSKFEEGPPFTLQRICEILLDPKGTYTDVSKLVSALGKNLLVTSMITKCTGPYPAAHGGPPSSEGAQVTENIGASDAIDVEPESLPGGHTEVSEVVPNGTEHAAGDVDEEMPDVEAEELSGSRDVEMQEEKPDQVLSVNPDANSDAAVATETVNISEPSSAPQS